VSRHTEMKGCEALTKATIESPDEIRQDKSYVNRKVFYKLVKFQCWPQRQLLRVIIEYTRGGRFHRKETGRIVSAMASFHSRPGEVLLWPK